MALISEKMVRNMMNFLRFPRELLAQLELAELLSNYAVEMRDTMLQRRLGNTCIICILLSASGNLIAAVKCTCIFVHTCWRLDS